MNVIIDAFGGDNAPDALIQGLVWALETREDFNVILIGEETLLNSKLNKYKYDNKRIKIVNAREIITNNESPVEAIRIKKDSSIVVGLKLLNTSSDSDVFVSAGSTGAVLAGAVLLLKRLEGVSRPALAPVLPTVNGSSAILIDCGANSECKPEMLLQFGKMGSAYAKAIFGIKNPRLALLSNGVEAKKGTELIREAHKLFQVDENINFCGNVEARDILCGNYEVIVADGFSGNIALKACEGTALMMFSLIKKGIEKGGIRAKFGYLLLKPVLKKIKHTLDYNNQGGAVLLGLKKLVIKAHGSCEADAFKATILQAVSLNELKVTERISLELTGFSV